MRKIYHTVFLIIILFLSGCKKQYTCNCTTQTVYESSLINTIVDSKSEQGISYKRKMTKKQAVAACKHEEGSIQSLHENMVNNNGKDSVKTIVKTECLLN